METAKVDLRKLQLLNDRIAQVIDALNQVRFSVHGLQHSAPGFVPGNAGFNTFPWQQQLSQYGAMAGQLPVMNPVAGLSHTPDLTQDPYARIREEQRIREEMAVRYGQVPFGAQPYGDPRFSPGFAPGFYGWGNTT